MNSRVIQKKQKMTEIPNSDPMWNNLSGYNCRKYVVF